VDQDEFVLEVGSNFQQADEEFLPDGTLQSFPLDGEFTSSTLFIGGRYGFTERFEGSFKLNFKQVNYESEPVILALPPDGADNQAVNDSIFDFGKAQKGAGDFYFRGRYNIHRGQIMVTTETELKLPTGYTPPGGTFENDEPNPATITDDVTLGDGQTDLTQRILLGVVIPATRTFARLDAGYQHRFGTPGDQVVGAFSLGQSLNKTWLLFGGVRGAYTVMEGQTIGQSFITRSPEKSAGELGVGDLETVGISLDSDFTQIEAGIIARLTDVEVRASYARIIDGENIPQINSFSLGLVYALPTPIGARPASSDQ
jgi:hypothetical protein